MMSHALKTKPPSLAEYADLIKADIEEGEQAGKPWFIAAGLKLIEVRDKYFPNNLKGLWDWGERNFDKSKATLSIYLDWAEAEEGASALKRPRTFETMADFRRSRGESASGLRSPWREYHEPVEKILSKVDQEELARTAARQREELAKVRELAEQIITIGYKTLATKLHPDIKGGSSHAMKLLNAARDRLRRALQ
jgi:hypothetical protein